MVYDPSSSGAKESIMNKLPADYEYPPGTCDGMADYLDSLRTDEHCGEDLRGYVNQDRREAMDTNVFQSTHDAGSSPSEAVIPLDQIFPDAPTPPKMKRLKELPTQVSLDSVLHSLARISVDIEDLIEEVQRLRG